MPGANHIWQVPISVGGAAFAWQSSLVIAMLGIGGTLILVFLLIEWRFAPLPIMPCKLVVFLPFLS